VQALDAGDLAGPAAGEKVEAELYAAPIVANMADLSGKFDVRLRAWRFAARRRVWFLSPLPCNSGRGVGCRVDPFANYDSAARDTVPPHPAPSPLITGGEGRKVGIAIFPSLCSSNTGTDDTI